MVEVKLVLPGKLKWPNITSQGRSYYLQFTYLNKDEKVSLMFRIVL